MSRAFSNSTIRRVKLVLMIILIGILIAIALREEFRYALVNEVSQLPAASLGALALALVAMRGFQAFALKYSLSWLGIPVRTTDCIQLAGLKGIYNLGFAGGGIAAQLAQATVALGIPARSFLASALLQSLLFLSSLLALFGVFALLTPAATPIFGGMTATAALTASAGLAWLTMAAVNPRFRTLRIKWLSYLEELDPYRRGRPPALSSFWGLATCTVGIHLARAARLVIILGFLAPAVRIDAVAAAVFASDLLAQLPLTPAGIGTRELALGYFGSQLNTFDLFVLAAIIDRTATIVFNVLHGVLSLVPVRSEGVDR